MVNEKEYPSYEKTLSYESDILIYVHADKPNLVALCVPVDDNNEYEFAFTSQQLDKFIETLRKAQLCLK